MGLTACSLYFPTDNTICDKPRGHDGGVHEAATPAAEPRLDNLRIGDDGKYHCGGCDAHDQ